MTATAVVPGVGTRSSLDFDRRPRLVLWETTRACLLACAHCRAPAMAHPLPGELSREHGLALIRQVAEFGRPYPILVLTGGDVLMRAGLYELISAASSIGIPTCVSPPVTPLLTRGAVARIKDVAMERFAMPFKIVRVRPDPRGFTEIDSRSPARRLA